MTEQQPRFSRKFLTILMIITAIAIALLSRTGTPPEPESGTIKKQTIETDKK